MKRFFQKKILNLFFFLLIFSMNSFTQEDNKNHNFEKLVGSLEFPEGPVWDGKNLFVSNCYGGYITKITPDTSYTFVDSVNNKFLKQTNGLAFDRDGNLFACDYGIGAILKISQDGKTEIYSNGFNGKKFNRPNDLAFDPYRNLYFTDPKSYGKDKLDGVVYRIDFETKEVKPVAKNLAFPNGIAFSENGKNLFICESAKNRIIRFDVDENSNLKNKTVFVELPGGDPDGIALDTNGNLFVAHFGGGKIFIISKDGIIKDSFETPGKKPSNVEFGGEDLRTLFITEDETNAVYKIRTESRGLKLFNKTQVVE